MYVCMCIFGLPYCAYKVRLTDDNETRRLTLPLAVVLSSPRVALVKGKIRVTCYHIDRGSPLNTPNRKLYRLPYGLPV